MSLGDFGRDMLAEAARIAEQAAARESTHLRWATVIDIDPLRIRYDGETNPSIVPPQTTSVTAPGDRVLIAKQHGQATILKTAGPEESAPFTIQGDGASLTLNNLDAGTTAGAIFFARGGDSEARILADNGGNLYFTARGDSVSSPGSASLRISGNTDIPLHFRTGSGGYIPIRAIALGLAPYSSTIANNAGVDLNVTLPAGVFTSPPRIITVPENGIRLNSSPRYVTTTDFQIRLYNWSGANAAGHSGVFWVAVQA